MSTALPRERGDGKIQGWHYDRLAVVYVRQSSRQQVAAAWACAPGCTTTSGPARAASSPASGGWPPWPARSGCRPRPCSDGSNAVGSPAAKTPGRPAAGSSPQTLPRSSASARCTSYRPAITTGAAGPTTATRSTPRRTRNPITMQDKTYAARTETTTSRPGRARARTAGAGKRSASPGRRSARSSRR